ALDAGEATLEVSLPFVGLERAELHGPEHLVLGREARNQGLELPCVGEAREERKEERTLGRARRSDQQRVVPRERCEQDAVNGVVPLAKRSRKAVTHGAKPRTNRADIDRPVLHSFSW